MSTRIGEGEVILVVRPSPLRRVVPVAAMLGLAGMLAWVALTGEAQGAVWRLAALVGAAALVLLARRFWAATSATLELTRDELRLGDGRRLCRLDEIERAERGALAFKPSNGLLLMLREPGQTAWAPGLWWRWGRRLAIGGALGAGQSRALGDTIKLLEAERRGLAGE